MAKDKNRGETARAGNPKDRDTSIDATSGTESDSELDIHALLRKYMPDYDTDDPDSKDKESADTSGSILKKIRSTDAVEANNEKNDAGDLLDLDAAFTAAPAKADSSGQTAPKQNPDAAEYEFTDDDIATVPSEDGYALEDEEGIYDEDDAPRKTKKEPKRTKQKKEKRSLFGRRQKRRDGAEEDHVLPPEEFFGDADKDAYTTATPVSMNFDTASVAGVDEAKDNAAGRDA